MLDRTRSQQSPVTHAPTPGSSFGLFQITRAAKLANTCRFLFPFPAGRVEGVLWYFPYENDQETVPLDPHTMGRMLLMANKGVDGPATQNTAAAGGLRALTQLGGPTQVAAWQTQRQTQAAGGRSLKQGQVAEQEPPEIEAAGECCSDLLMLAGLLACRHLKSFLLYCARWC